MRQWHRHKVEVAIAALERASKHQRPALAPYVVGELRRLAIEFEPAERTRVLRAAVLVETAPEDVAAIRDALVA